jgi:diguanylate cyclase (GGDEF)-like protein
LSSEHEAGRQEQQRRLAEAEAIGRELRGSGERVGPTSEGDIAPVDLSPNAFRAVRAIMELMREGAAMLDERGCVLHCNGRLGEMLRRPPGQLRGQSFSSFVSPEDADKWEAAFGAGDQQPALGCTLEVLASGHAIPVHVAICSLKESPRRLAFLVASDLAWQEERMKQLEKVNAEMERQREDLEEAATTDSITGAFTSGAVFEVLQVELAYGRRYAKPVSTLLLDLDDFKAVNDSYGHAYGDAVLREFCNRCREAIRTTDYLVRYGGDEFVVILPQTGSRGARAVGERILNSVRNDPFGEPPQRVPVTVSVGVATASAEEELTGSALLKRADQALYEVKRRGRDGLAAWGGKSRTHHGRRG